MVQGRHPYGTAPQVAHPVRTPATRKGLWLLDAYLVGVTRIERVTLGL